MLVGRQKLAKAAFCDMQLLHMGIWLPAHQCEACAPAACCVHVCYWAFNEFADSLPSK